MSKHELLEAITKHLEKQEALDTLQQVFKEVAFAYRNHVEKLSNPDSAAPLRESQVDIVSVRVSVSSSASGVGDPEADDTPITEVDMMQKVFLPAIATLSQNKDSKKDKDSKKERYLSSAIFMYIEALFGSRIFPHKDLQLLLVRFLVSTQQWGTLYSCFDSGVFLDGITLAKTILAAYVAGSKDGPKAGLEAGLEAPEWLLVRAAEIASRLGHSGLVIACMSNQRDQQRAVDDILAYILKSGSEFSDKQINLIRDSLCDSSLVNEKVAKSVRVELQKRAHRSRAASEILKSET